MTEKDPTFETTISQEKVAETFKERGLEDSGAWQLFLDWVEQEEKVADVVNTGRANVVVSMQKAFVFETAGLREIALEAYEQAREHAYQENQIDLYEMIVQKINELRGR